MALILLLETSGDICSVALAKDKQVLFEKSTPKDFSHSEHITIYIQEALEATQLLLKDLGAIAINSGPGSYTGLRIAASVAKGLCAVLGIPLIAIDSLTALAHQVGRVGEGEIILPLVDARRMDVYMAVFNDQMEMIEPVRFDTLDAEKWRSIEAKAVFTGSGAYKLKESQWYAQSRFVLQEEQASQLLIPAFQKYEQKKWEDVKKFSPFYLKNPNVTESKKNNFNI